MKSPQRLVDDYRDMNIDSKEPSLKIGAIISALATIGAVIAQFFPELDVNSKPFAIVATIFTILVPLLVSWAIRGNVWSPASVADLIDQLDSLKSQQAHPLDNLAKDFFSGEIKHSHASYIVCDKHCPRNPAYIPVSDDKL